MIGSDRVSALRKSSSNAFDSALSALASPNCSIRIPGWARSSSATAARIGPTRSFVAVRVARDVEVDQRRATVVGDLARVLGPQRRLEIDDRRELVQPLHDVADRGPERRVAHRHAGLGGLQQHLLAGAIAEAGVGEDLVGLTRLADPEVLVGDVLRAHGGADEHTGDDDRDPSEDRDPAVLGTPASSALRDVRARWHGTDLPGVYRGSRRLGSVQAYSGAEQSWVKSAARPLEANGIDCGAVPYLNQAAWAATHVPDRDDPLFRE